MTGQAAPIKLQSCPKAVTRDLDKAVAPETTVKNALARLRGCGADIFAGVRQVDVGRLGIPVYMAICGPDARQVMPVRKQMGKGSSAAQAQASAIMEFVERYSFFSFRERQAGFFQGSFEAARSRFGDGLLPVATMLASVNDDLPDAVAAQLLNLTQWQFYGATDLATGALIWLPLDWFFMLGEFNGSSAGNSNEESLLQGVCELVERHVCALIDRKRPQLATIDAASIGDPVLAGLVAAFRRNGVNLVLKDFSLGMPLPTVGALAWDERTFPSSSEIVFTAGTATTAAKAAIRAVTEVAQLGGDFCTSSCYEASGLPKFGQLAEIDWLLRGPSIGLQSLPDAGNDDIFAELQTAVAGLGPVYAIETTHPALGIPAHYCIAPGLQFRERDKNQSLGLFIGRKLVESESVPVARAGLAAIANACPGAHFLPFFDGMLALREEKFAQAASMFARAMPKQPDAEALALAAFYAGHANTLAGEWQAAAPFLREALANNPALAEAANLLGVCYFRQCDYAAAEAAFDRTLAIDKGMATALANRGVSRKLQGKKEAARQDLEAALALDASLDFAASHLAELARTE